MGLDTTTNVRLTPRGDTIHISQGRSVLSSGLDGFIHPGSAHGLFVFETRVLSRYEMTINGQPPYPVALSSVEQHSWLGYYIAADLDVLDPEYHDFGSGQVPQESEKSLEMRLSRYIGDGIHEDIDFTNFTQEKIRFRFAIRADADFADQLEIGGRRLQQGRIGSEWLELESASVLHFRYTAEHRYAHQDFVGEASIQRGLQVSLRNFSTPPRFEAGELGFEIELEPKETWHACVDLIPEIENKKLQPPYSCHSFNRIRNEYDVLRDDFLKSSTSFRKPGCGRLANVVVTSLEQAKRDLASMRLYDLDRHRNAWTVAAGLPIYIALFGRDTLTSGWQSALVSPDLMHGTLPALADVQGQRYVDWLDEQPGRMIHEMHTGPLSALRYGPQGSNYGSVTTSNLYPFLVAQLWHWTGDKDIVGPMIEPALRALQWVERYGDMDGDGLYEYRTRSEQGVRNQGWKDSESAIVYHDGTLVEPPIAVSEEQGFLYASKYFFADTLWWFGRKAEARLLFRQANELKKRFNEAFWNEDLGFMAMALDSRKRQVCSVGSDAGHCLAAGIIDTSLVPKVADRLMKPDLFSGWGVRTLSSDHPAYNPYSYHRGSVWPVENGTFALAFARNGFQSHLHTLSRAFFESASLFDFCRLPEVMSGHSRDMDHPFPALYPRANSPQAWSSSATFLVLQALLGLYPYAPLKTLIIDPHLPAWLSRIDIVNLKVGQARVSIRFFRKPDGRSDYTILAQEGSLRVLRQPNPWSQTATWGERVSDLIQSFLH